MKLEYSAGGVVYKQEKGKMLILIAQHSGHHGWVFPKGLIGDQKIGETKEQTAVREVKEETGVKAEILQPLLPETYWYIWKNEKREKTVQYFLMRYISGDITKHDWEMENVEWLAEKEVENRLTYPSDKKVWMEARKKLSTISDATKTE